MVPIISKKDSVKKPTLTKAAFFLLLALLISTSDTVLASHASYWFQSGDSKGCGRTEYHEDCGNKDCSTWSDFACGSWQKSEASSISWQEDDGDGKTMWYARCYCAIACLQTPANPAYNDDPTPKNHANNDTNKITLPVTLSWNNIAGWKNLGNNIATCTGKDSDCDHSRGYNGRLSQKPGANNFGPQSYRIEIQDTTSQNGIDNLNFAAESSDDMSLNKEYAKRKSAERIMTIGGKMAYYKAVGTNMWNSATDAWPCFFNSNGKYRWRVRPCCDTFGSDCKEYGDEEGWWYFSISTAPEIVGPSDKDWNGNGPSKNGDTADRISFTTIKEGDNPLKWCSAKLPDELQIEGLPTKYAESYQLYVTSNEDNDVVNGLQGVINSVTSAYNNLMGWLGFGSSGETEAEDEQKTHALSVINGQIISDIFSVNGSVDTWYPAQARGDVAYFSRDRSYTWVLKSCPNDATRDEFEDHEDNEDCYEDSSQQWKFITKYEKIPAPDPISPKDDASGENPVGFPININWSIPAGANSFQFNTDIGNFTGDRPTTWSTIPNKETQEVDPNALTLNDPAIKLNTVYHWKVKSCAMFDSGKKNPGDCDDWSKEYSFVTTGRPPKLDSMKPDLGTTISFPQNFTWEAVGGAKSFVIELYDSNYQKLSDQTVKYDSKNGNPPIAQFDYPNITQPAEGTANITYHWRVKTCADEEAKRCGDWGNYQNFTVYRINAPKLTSDKDEFDSLKDLGLKWDSQTKINLVLINYSGGSPQEGCSTGGEVTNFKSIDKACTFSNGCVDRSSVNDCAGTYSYTIYPCVDVNCSDRGEALTGTFKVKATGASTGMDSFKVCGQNTDNLDTKWKETDDCSIASFFLVVKLIINFLLFKLAFMLLPVLALITGGMFYLGMHGKDTIPTVKRMWKYAGIGYALMFMAWLLVSWLMAATGYNSVPWYQVF